MKRSRSVSRYKWTLQEKMILSDLWPTGDRQLMRKMLNKTWRAIKEMARRMSIGYKKELINLSPNINKSFFDNTYEQMLLKAGKKVTPAHLIESNFAQDIRNMRKTRPEYNAEFKNPIDQ